MVRKLTYLLSMSLLGLTNVAMGVDASLVPADVKNLYVPYGYDSNDQVEVVLHGYLPNSCYKPGKVDVEVDEERGVVKLFPTWYYHNFQFCNEILVEYRETVNLGYLAANTYQILVPESSQYALLDVTEAHSNNQDDYTYLPVEDLNLEKNQDGQVLVLTGTFPPQTDNCISPSTHKVYRNPSNVLVVLPIGKVEPCAEGQQKNRFEYRIPLSEELKVKNNTLIHVRSLNGRSVNKVYDKLVLVL